jgi:O-methyltransferase
MSPRSGRSRTEAPAQPEPARSRRQPRRRPAKRPFPPDCYLELLKRCVTNLVYLEYDVRNFIVERALAAGEVPDRNKLRDIRRDYPEYLEGFRRARMEGLWYTNWQEELDTSYFHSMIGMKRLDNIEDCMRTALADNIPGDLVDAGTWRGGSAIFMCGVLRRFAVAHRRVWVADTFSGFPAPKTKRDRATLQGQNYNFISIDLDTVKDAFARYDLLDDRVRFLEGTFRDTLRGAPIGAIAVLRADGDLYSSTMDILRALYDRVSPGGFVIVDDYGAIAACREAVDKFRTDRAIREPIKTIDVTGIFWRKN